MGASDPVRGVLTVAFLDVEGSTQLLERMGDDAGTSAIRGVLKVARELLASHEGREVKAMGDGLMIAFDSPRHAVSYALATQRALDGAGTRVRIGINTGEVDQADADPLGGAVNAAARIATKAGGGEVWVSDVVRQLIGSYPAIQFVDRGRVRLKGFSDRWHLWSAEGGAPRRPVPVTVGRADEAAALDELIRSTAAGTGGALLFEGESGIGKSHLIRDGARRATEAGLLTVEYAFDEVVRRPAALGHALVAAAGGGREATHLAGLLAPGAFSGEDDLRFALIEATVDLVEAIAGDHRVLIVADDLQWSDEVSSTMLLALVRRLATAPWSLIGALRPAPRPTTIDRLIECTIERGGRHVRLGGLRPDAVETLAASITGAPPGPVLRARLRSTAGNPLYITEFVRSVEDDGSLTVRDGVAEVAEGVAPADLHQTLLRRLSWLPGETIELLRLAAVLGGSFTLRDLGHLTGRSVVDVAAVLRDATTAGLLAGEVDRLSFRHDLIREAVYSSLLAAERRDLHRAAADALARAGAPAAQIAQQMVLGADAGDLGAVEWLERAGAEAAAIAPAEAVAWYERALAVAPAGWDGRWALQTRLIEPLVWTGRMIEAEAVAAEVLDAAPDDAVRFAALHGLASVYGNRGESAKACEMIRRAAEVPGAPAAEVTRLLCIDAQLSCLIGTMSVDEATERARRTLVIADESGDATTRCVALQVLGWIAVTLGYGAEAREHLHAATALLEPGRATAHSYISPDGFEAVALLVLDDPDAALAAAQRVRRRAEQHGVMALLPLSLMTACGALYYAGRLDEALVEAEAARSIMDECGSRNFALYLESVVALIALHRGDVDGAGRALAAGIEQLATGGSLFGVDWLLNVQAQWLEATGDDAGALALSENAWMQTERVRYFLGAHRRAGPLVRRALAAGRRDLAETVVAAIEEAARRSPAATAAAAARLARAQIDDDADGALDALALVRSTPMLLDIAPVAEAAGQLLAQAGRRQEAVAVLRDAQSRWADLGATGDAARVGAALAALGVRSRRVHAVRPTTGWESLTAAELKVCTLVADGLTNPQIGAQLLVSRRTVDTHLAHVFTKLGLSSRSQVAAEVATRRAVAGTP